MSQSWESRLKRSQKLARRERMFLEPLERSLVLTVLSISEAVGVPLPSGNVWRDRLVGALAHGEGEHD